MLSGAKEEAQDDSSINRQQDSSEGDERKGGCILFYLVQSLIFMFMLSLRSCFFFDGVQKGKWVM
jgi:hypothetical protein